MNETVLELEKLTIALPRGGDRANAVCDVDLTLHAGKVTCLIGESGSGKSLVARSILGLLPGPQAEAICCATRSDPRERFADAGPARRRPA